MVAALVAVAPTGASAPVKTKRAAAGGVATRITYRSPNVFSASDVRLRIVRRGKTLLDRTLDTQSVPVDLRVRDLDGDGEPEVLADFYSGGPHCCTTSRFYRYERGTYRLVAHAWGNVGYRLADPDSDRVPELMSFDDRFAYAFTAYAASFFPIRIWELRGRRLFDVTREYPELVERDAAALWRDYLRLRRKEDVAASWPRMWPTSTRSAVPTRGGRGSEARSAAASSPGSPALGGRRARRTCRSCAGSSPQRATPGRAGSARDA